MEPGLEDASRFDFTPAGEVGCRGEEDWGSHFRISTGKRLFAYVDTTFKKMKKIILLLVVAFIAYLVLPKGWLHPDPMAKLASQAVARGDLRFQALINEDGTKNLPEILGIPPWYFQTAGIKPLSVPPAAMSPKVLRDIKSYNDALLREIKSQGKFHLLEEDVERVRSKLEIEKQLQMTNR